MAASISEILFTNASTIKKNVVKRSRYYHASKENIYATQNKIKMIVAIFFLIGVTSLGIICFNLYGLYIGSLTLKNIIIPTIASSISLIISLKAIKIMKKISKKIELPPNHWADLFYS